jgi:hypothetical protein
LNFAKDISWPVFLGFIPDAVSALLRELLEDPVVDMFLKRERGITDECPVAINEG